MGMFRKKPVVIEAVQWFGKYTDGTEWPDWFRDAVNAEIISFCYGRTPTLELQIKTLEGVMHGMVSDWIIKGVKGEIYPCKPDIFYATYDSV